VWLTNPDGSVYIGAGWPGYTVYPDWRHPNTSAWWLNELALWGQSIKFDGIWIDMNEVSSSCVGSCGSAYVTQGAEHEARGFDAAADATTPTPGVRDINYPPYVINHVQPGHDLAVGAVSPNATHVDGVQEYDVHNLYGYQETNGTYQALTQIIPGKRPFILSRSTFAGSGKWAAHWGGDNLSDWLHMFLSIPQALSFSLYGIPMFGVDTCGFENNTDEELCNRWMMLSAFFPFYRNHNCIGSIPQEPYQWTTVTQASKFIMGIRYALLPYMYTLFHDAHTTGSTVMRALAWEFPNDPSLAAADRQFLLGPSLMIIPVLDQGATSVDGVFPGIAQGEIWYDYYTQTEMAVQAGVNTTLDTPLGHIQLFIRGGSVLPMQQPALVTRDVRNSPWSLLVALSGNGTASGSLYVDDGESIVQNATLSIDFKANTTDTETGSASSSSSLYASVSGDFQDTNGLGNVTILGVSSVGNVTFNGNAVGSDSIAYNQDSKVLIVNGLLDLTQSGAWDQDWVLSW
jgi:alpha-glucosidase